MHTRSHYLGLDAGGTKTSWCCIDAAGESLANGRAAAAQPAVAGTAAAGRVLVGLLGELHSRFSPTVTVVGIAGGGAQLVRDELAAVLADAGFDAVLRICGDPEIAAAAGLWDGPGLAVWSGTGSFVIARSRDGTLVRGGGRGYLLGDQGSGFAIVRSAAAAAVDAVDGVGNATLLGEQLRVAFDVPRVEDLGGCLQRLSSRELAAKVPLVFEAERQGDRVACEVLDRQADRLALLARKTAERAEVPAAGCVVGGGVLVHFPTLVARLAVRLGGDVSSPSHSAARGAALLARAVDQRVSPQSTWLP